MRPLTPLLVVALGCAALLAPSPTSAAGQPSFAGSCTLSGTESFTPPLARAARPGAATVTAAGSCSGTLVDADGVPHALHRAAATYRQTTAATRISCIGGTARGSGVLTVADTALRFDVTEPQLTVLSTLTYSAPTWAGTGFASVAPTANPLALALACASGGIAEVPVVLVARLRAR
jgi:hypothetical protein